MMKLALFASAFLISLWCLIVGAAAHDWYPPVCCSDRDCAPMPPGSVREETRNGQAGYLIVAKDLWLAETDSRVKRIAPDGDIHGCFIGEMLICLLLPLPAF
jgi:hypothetical protein